MTQPEHVGGAPYMSAQQMKSTATFPKRNRGGCMIFVGIT